MLGKKTKANFEALQSLLSMDPLVKQEHRSKALYLLGRWGDAAPIKAIRSIFFQLDEIGRISAIDALGRLGTKEALAGVLECADDSSADVRKFVIHALGRMGKPEAQRKLKEIQAKDPVFYIRSLATKYIKYTDQN